MKDISTVESPANLLGSPPSPDVHKGVGQEQLQPFLVVISNSPMKSTLSFVINTVDIDLWMLKQQLHNIVIEDSVIIECLVLTWASLVKSKKWKVMQVREAQASSILCHRVLQHFVGLSGGLLKEE